MATIPLRGPSLPSSPQHTHKHTPLALTAQMLLECLSFQGVYRVSRARVSNSPGDEGHRLCGMFCSSDAGNRCRRLHYDL